MKGKEEERKRLGGNIPSKEDAKCKGFTKPIQVPDSFVSLQMLLYKEEHNIKIHVTGRKALGKSTKDSAAKSFKASGAHLLLGVASSNCHIATQ